jgi:two-component system, OmpR family, sensor histidine kinase KdpD
MPSWLPQNTTETPTAKAYVQVLVMVGLAACAGAALRQVVPIQSVTALLLLPVVGAALFWGARPALAAALLAIACASLFYDPVLSFRVRARRDIVDLVVFALVALAVSRLGEALRQRTNALRRHEAELRRLYELSHEIAAAPDAGTILNIVVHHLSTVLGRPVELLTRADLSRPDTLDRFPADVVTAAQSMLGEIGQSRLVVRTTAGGTWLVACIGPFGEEGVAVAANLGPLVGTEPATLDEAASILEEGASSLERLGLARALDERRLREKMDEARTALIDSTSHELRTPLATIQGAVTALRDVPAVAADDRLAAITELATQECRRLDRVIQNMLDAGRVRSGQLTARPQVVELAEILRDAIRQAGLRLAGHRLDLAIPDNGPFVTADPQLTGQALINILENAAKFSNDGATIAVTIETTDGQGIVRIADSGRGLEPGETGRVFDRFFRGSAARESTGSGLGLNIAKAFVEASHGRIGVTSAGPGLGATFTVHLPLAHAGQVPDDDD